jgi:catechol 2,3-dioxygenase-like lactoylglutathione lyase family enzyme
MTHGDADSHTHRAQAGLHHIALKAHDWDASIAVYTALNFAVRLVWGAAGSRVAFLAAPDGTCLELFEPGAIAGPDVAGLNFEEAIPHVCFRSADVDRDCAVAASLGMEVIWESQDRVVEVNGQPVEVRLCFLRGPSGEVVELISGMPDWSGLDWPRASSET